MKKQFNWTHRGETKWTDAEVELLLRDHQKFMVAEEVGPIKDELDNVKKAHATQLADLDKVAKATEKEMAALKKTNEELDTEMKPVREQNLFNKRKVLAVGLIKDDLMKDAFMLAGITETDDDKTVTAKLNAVVKDRDYLKAPVETEADKAARIAKEAAEKTKIEQAKRQGMTPEQLAAITQTKTPGKEQSIENMSLEQLANLDVAPETMVDDGMPSWNK